MEEEGELKKLPLNEDLPVCPSFSSYSAGRVADIAAKVGEEFAGEEIESPDEEDEDFEFSFVRCEDHYLTAAEIIGGDGKFREVFPIFNRDLLNNVNQGGETSDDASTLKIQLKNLFLEERGGEEQEGGEEQGGGDPLSSSSSSEVDELESIPSDTYCVWKPKAVEASPSTCKKSRSTGSGSKRWKLRDLLGRSNSDGKSTFVFLTPKRDQKQKSQKVEISEQRRNSDTKPKKATTAKTVSSGEKLTSPAPAYLRKGGMKEGDKRKSYLPYRKDLVGFFTSVNGIGRSFPPF